MKAQFGPRGHEHLQGCSLQLPWVKAVKASCTKGYNKEAFLGEGEIYNASTRAIYL